MMTFRFSFCFWGLQVALSNLSIFSWENGRGALASGLVRLHPAVRANTGPPWAPATIHFCKRDASTHAGQVRSRGWNACMPDTPVSPLRQHTRTREGAGACERPVTTVPAPQPPKQRILGYDPV